MADNLQNLMMLRVEGILGVGAGVMDGHEGRKDAVAHLPVGEWLLLCFMGVVTLGLYYPALLAPYCILDDLILESCIINNPTWSYVRQLLGIGPDAFGVGAYFRPLSDLLFYLIGKVFGLEPAAFHLFNVLIHLANGFLIYFMIKKMCDSHPAKIWLAFTAATLFLVHPVNVEAVAWISGRPAVLSTFFIVLAFFLHLRVERDFKDWHLWAAALCYLLSLLSYELTAPMSLAFMYWDLDHDPQKGWRKSAGIYYRRWLLYGAVLATYVLYRLPKGVSEPGTEDGGGSMVFTFLEAFLHSPSSPVVAIGLYLKKMFWPWPLNFYIDGASPVARPFYLVGGVAFVLVLAWWVWKRTWSRFWGVWFLCGLLAVLPLSFFGFSWTGMAERYVYLSSISFAAFVALLSYKVMAAQPGWAARTVEALTLLLLFVFGIGATMRAALWQSNVALMQDTWEKNPTSARVAYGYGLAVFQAGKEEESIKMWQKAMELGYISDPSRLLGNIEKDKKNYAAAERYYLQALWPIGRLSGPEAKPVRELGLTHQRDPNIYLALVDLHLKMAGEDPTRMEYHRERIIHFHEAACKLEPRNAYFRYLLAKAHLRFGDTGKARKIFAQVSEMAPNAYYGEAAAKLARGEKVPAHEVDSRGPNSDAQGAPRRE